MSSPARDADDWGAGGESRRRKEIARIIDDMNHQLFNLAEAHDGMNCRRSKLKVWWTNVVARGRLVRLAKQGGAALIHRSLRKGLNKRKSLKSVVQKV